MLGVNGGASLVPYLCAALWYPNELQQESEFGARWFTVVLLLSIIIPVSVMAIAVLTRQTLEPI